MAADSVSFDRAAGIYDATRGFPPGVESAVAALFAHAGALGPASRALEIGIGTGRVAMPLAAIVGRYCGVDLSQAMLAQLAAKRGALPIEVARADATRLPFADARFDAAVGVHVFHLIPGWRAVLAELARVLKPDGVLLHGGDDDTRSGAMQGWRQILEGAAPPNVGVPRAELESFPESAGWRPAGVERTAFVRRQRPGRMLELMASRAWSATWRMSDEQLTATVDALRARLLERFGDLDREIEVETGFWVRAYRPPSQELDRRDRP